MILISKKSHILLFYMKQQSNEFFLKIVPLSHRHNQNDFDILDAMVLITRCHARNSLKSRLVLFVGTHPNF